MHRIYILYKYIYIFFFFQETYSKNSKPSISSDCVETFLYPGRNTRHVYDGCCRSLMDLTNSSTMLNDYFKAHYDAKDINNTSDGNNTRQTPIQQQQKMIEDKSNHHIKHCKKRLQSGGSFVNYGLPIIGLIVLFINTIQIVVLISNIRKYWKRIEEQHKINSLVFILNLSFTDAAFGLGAFFYGVFNEDEKLATLPDIFRILVCGTMSIISVWTLVAITVQRLYAVMKPLKFRQQGPKIYIIIGIAIWIASIILVVIYYFKLHKDDVAFDLVLSLIPILTFPAVTIFLFCYLCIWFTLRNRPINLSTSNVRQEKKILRLAVFIIIAFTVCWLPVSIFGLYKRYKTPDDAETENRLVLIQVSLFSLILLNSFINPILYFNFIKTSIEKFVRRCLDGKQNDENALPLQLINNNERQERRHQDETNQDEIDGTFKV